MAIFFYLLPIGLIFLLQLFVAVRCASSVSSYVMQQECGKYGNLTGQTRQSLFVTVNTWLKVSLTDRHGYEANLDCTITFRTEGNRVLLFKLDDLEMERSRDCVNDFLLISNTMRGDVVLCGSGKRVDSFYSFNSTITLRFVSNRDLMNTMRGFSGYFTVLNTESCSEREDLFSCKNGFCVDETLECNGFDNCGDNSDEILCKEKQWYIISLITASLFLGLFLIAAVITYFTKRRNRLRNNARRNSSFSEHGEAIVDPTSLDLKKQKNKKPIRPKFKKTVNFSAPIVNCNTADEPVTSPSIESPSVEQPQPPDLNNNPKEWNRLIFDNTKQGQLHLYSIPDTQNFSDLKNRPEEWRLSCPEFLAIQELMRTTCDPKGFSSHLRNQSINGQRQASLHQLCALCLLANMEPPQNNSVASPIVQPSPLMTTMNCKNSFVPNFTGYKCPHSCPKDTSAFYMQHEDVKIRPRSDPTPTITILSRAPSHFLGNNNGKPSSNFLPRKPTPSPRHFYGKRQAGNSVNRMIKVRSNSHNLISSDKSSFSMSSTDRPSEIISNNSASSTSSYSRPLIIVNDRFGEPMASEAGKQEKMGDFFFAYSSKNMSTGNNCLSKDSPLLTGKPSDQEDGNKNSGHCPHNRRALSHDIVCKHKGRKVRILSKTLTVPSPTKCFEEEDDSDVDDDDQNDVNNGNNNSVNVNNRLPLHHPAVCVHHASLASSSKNNSQQDDRDDVTYAVVERRPLQSSVKQPLLLPKDAIEIPWMRPQSINADVTAVQKQPSCVNE